jgi:DNA-directed RNA polymerase subunit RPC12/RpoP
MKFKLDNKTNQNKILGSKFINTSKRYGLSRKFKCRYCGSQVIIKDEMNVPDFCGRAMCRIKQ